MKLSVGGRWIDGEGKQKKQTSFSREELEWFINDGR